MLRAAKLPVAESLLNRHFKVAKPNQVWVGDITYIQTNQGCLYLAVMIDSFSRKVVGWQISDYIDQQLVNDALLFALVSRGYPKVAMIHTDRGSQYCAQTFLEIIGKYELIRGMSRRGNCWESEHRSDAVAERFFATFKK